MPIFSHCTILIYLYLWYKPLLCIEKWTSFVKPFFSVIATMQVPPIKERSDGISLHSLYLLLLPLHVAENAK